MKKQIKSLLPLTGLILFHFLFCGFLTFTEAGKAFLVFVLITVWFWLVIHAGLFYLCGRWSQRQYPRKTPGQICISVTGGTLYALIFPFFIGLESFARWGHWSAPAVRPTLEGALFILVPFLMAFVPCLLGQVLECKKSVSQ